jgi:sec-independent protein translocase protein TatB
MFGFTFEKLLLIGVLAAVVIGPARLPKYAAQLARLIKALKSVADSAKDRVRDEMGPEFDDVDWQKLDPRQYDPRRIIREALLDDTVVVRAPSSAAVSAESASDGHPQFASGSELPAPEGVVRE